MTRIRKAWRVWPDWYDGSDGWDCIYAPAASKARYKMFRRLEDTPLIKIRVRRWSERDMRLPDPSNDVLALSIEEQGIILHAAGISHGLLSFGFRKHYVTYPDNPICTRLAEKGFMYKRKSKVLPPDQVFFNLTSDGMQAAHSLVPLYGRM